MMYSYSVLGSTANLEAKTLIAAILSEFDSFTRLYMHFVKLNINIGFILERIVR